MTQILIGLAGTCGVGCIVLGIMLALSRSEAKNLTLIAKGRAIEITQLRADLDLSRAAAETVRKRLESVIEAKEKALVEVLKDLDDCTTPSAVRARLNRLTGGHT